MPPDAVEITVAKMEGEFHGMQADIDEVKRDMRELRVGQGDINTSLQDIKFTLGSITAQLEKPAVPSASSPLIARTEVLFKWTARILVIIFVLGVGGGISINYEQIDRLLDTVSHAKKATTSMTSK